MANRFSSGKNSIAICDRCGGQYKLTELRKEVLKTRTYNLLVCSDCWDPDHPQLQLGMYPVDDPQGVREPRPDTTYDASANGATGSRDIQWGWAPVGGPPGLNASSAPNDLVATTQVGTVTIVTT